MWFKTIKMDGVEIDITALGDLSGMFFDAYLNDIIIDGVSLAAAGLPPFEDRPLWLFMEFRTA